MNATKSISILLISLIGTDARAGYTHPVSLEEKTEITTIRQSFEYTAAKLLQILRSSKNNQAAIPAVLPKEKTAPVNLSLPERAKSQFTVPTFAIDGKSSQKIRTYSSKARAMKLPKREYLQLSRAQTLFTKWREYIEFKAHNKIRNPLQIQLLALAKTLPLWPESIHEILSLRLDALFAILQNDNAFALAELWNLANREDNLTRFRDALFFGYIAITQNSPRVAAIGFHKAISTGIESDIIYFSKLWRWLEKIEPEILSDKIIASTKAKNWLQLPAGTSDKSFYLAAKNNPELTGQAKGKITDIFWQEKISLLQIMRAPKKEAQHIQELEKLSASAQTEINLLANIELGRLAAANGNYAQALEHYRLVKTNRGNRLDVLLEIAYLEYKTGQLQESVGKSVGLTSAFFRYGFVPDVYFLEANARKAMCDFGGAELALKRFESTYRPEVAGLEDLLKQAANTKADYPFYNHAITAFSAPNPKKFERYFLHLPSLHSSQKLLSGWPAELAIWQKEVIAKYKRNPDDKKWQATLNAIHSTRGEQIKTHSMQANRLIEAEANYLLSRLYKLFGQLELLNLDITTQASHEYSRQAALNYPVAKAEATAINAERLLWPFETEVWEDELDYLRVRNPSRCAMVSKLADSE